MALTWLAAPSPTPTPAPAPGPTLIDQLTHSPVLWVAVIGFFTVYFVGKAIINRLER